MSKLIENLVFKSYYYMLISNMTYKIKSYSNIIKDDNTWFNSNIKLNQQDILKSISSKTKSEYDLIDAHQKDLIRSKTDVWPPHSEYIQKFALKSNV